jgi:Holliday junction DNA helicase RuvA
MIAALRGTVLEEIPEGIVLDVQGVGYEVFLPPVVAQALAGREQGSQVELKIAALATRDQPLPVLYGFLSNEEKQFWLLLRTVPKIGPKGAARALVLPVNRIAAAIRDGNRGLIDNLPGVSADGADKIIAALKKKVDRFASLEDGEESTATLSGDREELKQDSLALLVDMGVRRAEALVTVNRILESQPEITRVEDVVTEFFRKP